MFRKLSLYPEDYYTIAEYTLLKDLIEKNNRAGYVLFYVQLRDSISDGDPIAIAKEIEESDSQAPIEENMWNIMFNTPYSNIPLYINDEYLSTICQWRLQINK